MNRWKKRVLGAVVLAFGMMTTIATSPVEYRMSETIGITNEAGTPTTIVVFVDQVTGDQSGVGLRLSLTPDAPVDAFDLVLGDSNGRVQEVPVEELPDGTLGADYSQWSDGITCYPGAERCSYVVTIVPTTPVPYTVDGSVDVVSSSEFAEDALFLVDVEVDP